MKQSPTYNANSDSILGRPEDMAGGDRLVQAGVTVVDIAGDVDSLWDNLLICFTQFQKKITPRRMPGQIGKK